MRERTIFGRTWALTGALTLSGALLAAPAAAHDPQKSSGQMDQKQMDQKPMSHRQMGERMGHDRSERSPRPYSKANDTWISINGTVRSVRPDTFELDYGPGRITVEMDDGDRDADAYKLVEGDKVTVNGFVDDDLFQSRTIEASSVYVDKLNTYFWSSSIDEEDRNYLVTTYYVPSRITVQGYVTEVDDDEFVLDTGVRRVTIELDELGYDPLDGSGYQQIEVGDRVTVTGIVDYDFLEGRELVASTVTELFG